MISSDANIPMVRVNINSLKNVTMLNLKSPLKMAYGSYLIQEIKPVKLEVSKK